IENDQRTQALRVLARQPAPINLDPILGQFPAFRWLGAQRRHRSFWQLGRPSREARLAEAVEKIAAPGLEGLLRGQRGLPPSDERLVDLRIESVLGQIAVLGEDA